jgi:Ca-activated chloride channel family protein
MEWAHAKNLTALWFVPALAALFLFARARRKTLLSRFGDPELVRQLTESFLPGRRHLKRALFLLAVALAVVALGQPHWRKGQTRVERKGIDVFIAIDVSRSMLAKDIAPTRLDKAKLELAGLIDRLPSDRVGLIAFAGEAMIQCPLTLDRGAAKLFLSTVNPNLVAYQGTSLSKAIRTALSAFPKEESGSRALVLLTDGEDQEPGAVEAAKKAREAGVPVFVIGIGTPDGSVLPAEEGSGHKKDRSGEVVISRLNESLLKDVARAGAGSYWRASRGELGTDRLLGELRRISQKKFGAGWSVEYEETFQFFVMAAWILLAAEMMISERKRT